LGGNGIGDVDARAQTTSDDGHRATHSLPRSIGVVIGRASSKLRESAADSDTRAARRPPARPVKSAAQKFPSETLSPHARIRVTTYEGEMVMPTTIVMRVGVLIAAAGVAVCGGAISLVTRRSRLLKRTTGGSPTRLRTRATRSRNGTPASIALTLSI